MKCGLLQIRGIILNSKNSKNQLVKLLDGSLESFYWLGFLFADGSFVKDERISLCISSKDINHLYKYCDFLGVPRKRVKTRVVKAFGSEFQSSGLVVKDVITFRNLKSKYSIFSNKTKNPPDISTISDKDSRMSLWLGFLDGDGSVVYQTGRNDVSLKIKCHHSWGDFIEKLAGSSGKINKQGYYELVISDNEILRKWKRFAIENDLPVMERKWDRVDTSRVSRYVSSKVLQDNVKYLNSIGMRNIDVSRQLQICKGYVSKILGS